MNIIKIDPSTRVNEQFVISSRINAAPIAHDSLHPLITSGPINRVLSHTKYTADFYSKIALDIVTETVFNYPYPYFTEKTLRPINCKRMFIIVGPPGMLKVLHSLGIETFGDIINESYDDIIDAEERFLSIIDSIEQFCEISLEEIKEYYNNNRRKFDHNWHVMKNLANSEILKFTKSSLA
jgi:hypothetical protein